MSSRFDSLSRSVFSVVAAFCFAAMAVASAVPLNPIA